MGEGFPRGHREVREHVQIGELADFDMDYFRQLEGEDGWIAIGQEECRNQRYFTVVDERGEKLGIVGMYDTDDEKNITHTVVDPKYRGRKLAPEFKMKLLDVTGEDYFISTVDLDNKDSLTSMHGITNIEVTSDQEYEEEFHKRRFRYER